MEPVETIFIVLAPVLLTGCASMISKPADRLSRIVAAEPRAEKSLDDSGLLAAARLMLVEERVQESIAKCQTFANRLVLSQNTVNTAADIKEYVDKLRESPPAKIRVTSEYTNIQVIHNRCNLAQAEIFIEETVKAACAPALGPSPPKPAPRPARGRTPLRLHQHDRCTPILASPR